MATKKERRTKELIHRMRMEQKKADDIWFEGVKVGCDFTLFLMQSCLSESPYNFDQEKLDRLKYDMNRRSIYIDEGVLDYSDLHRDFDNKEIDPSKLNKEYQDKLDKIREAIRE